MAEPETRSPGNPNANGPLWNNLTRILFVFGLLMGGLAAYLYWGYGEQLRAESAELDEKNRQVALENERLKEHVGYLTQRLDEEVAKVSREKEDEIARLRATHDEMVKTLQKEVEQGQVKVTQLADRLSINIVDKVLFPSGEDQITEQGREVLRRVGKILAQAKDKTIRIEGHTDNVPTGKHLKDRFPTNWELSTARATNVVRFLQDEAQIDPTSLEAIGRGEYQPIASNKTPAGRGQNRRIEIILYPRVRAVTKELAPTRTGTSKPPAAKPATDNPRGTVGK
jgi:chemotaxis protein MotB